MTAEARGRSTHSGTRWSSKGIDGRAQGCSDRFSDSAVLNGNRALPLLNRVFLPASVEELSPDLTVVGPRRRSSTDSVLYKRAADRGSDGGGGAEFPFSGGYCFHRDPLTRRVTGHSG